VEKRKTLTVRCPGTILVTVFNQSFFSSLPEYQISTVSSFDSLKGQNLGFPLRPYLRSCAPFFSAVMAFTLRKNVPQCNQVNLTKALNMKSCYHGTSVQVHSTLSEFIGRRLSLQDFISAQSMRCGTMGKWHNVASRPCSSSQGDFQSVKNCCLSLALM
jgi:hypothetical protein